MYVDNIVDGILKGLNEQVAVMCCNIIDLIVTITIIFFLVPKIGLMGFVISIIVSEILNFTISCIQLKKRINYVIPIFSSIILPIIASLFAYFITSLFKISFSSIVIGLIFNITIFIVVFLIIVSGLNILLRNSGR